jgi:hypothetical protein
MECKKEDCNSVEFYEKEIIDSLGRAHTQIRCKVCDGYYTTKKRPENIGKTSEDYKNEYMSKQKATDKQISCIKKLLEKNITMLQATSIIDTLINN